MRIVVVALGSNLGNRDAAFTFAVDRLRPLISNLTLSRFIETDPKGKGFKVSRVT